MAKLLVVDDSATVRNMVQIMLKDGGHHADTAEHAGAAFAALECGAYDILIIDQNMPGLTGIEATKMIRTKPKFSRMKIVILSADSRTKHGDASMVAGADAYLDKPITPEKLHDAVNAVLGLAD